MSSADSSFIDQVTFVENFALKYLLDSGKLNSWDSSVKGGSIVRRLQTAVHAVKCSREMEGRYMGFQEMLDQQFQAGLTEGKSDSIVLLLESKGAVSDSLKEQIRSQKDLNTLEGWLKKAIKAQSVEAFMEMM